MNSKLALLETLGEVFSNGERFDPFDHSAAFASLLERDHTHASDELMHFRCYLLFPLMTPSFSHKWLLEGGRRMLPVFLCFFLLDERNIILQC